MTLLLILLIVLAVVALLGGGWGYSRPGYGYWSFSPLAVILVVLLILWLAGVL
jgi:hypothetical protein